MIIRKYLATMLVALLMLGAETGTAEEWQAEAGDRLQERAEKAINRVRAEVERARREWPFLRDRRIDAYGDLERRMRDES